jgi:hypothetical protein
MALQGLEHAVVLVAQGERERREPEGRARA